MATRNVLKPRQSKNPQLRLLRNDPKEYGGDLLKKRNGRIGGRPLDTKNTMHMVLRSSRAKGKWSFSSKENKPKIESIVTKFALKYGVKIVRLAKVGNHLHFEIKLGNRFTYFPFIRAITSAIAMAVTGASRWNPLKGGRFWDLRPFTRVVVGSRARQYLQDYIRLNQFEGDGCDRMTGRVIVDFRLNGKMILAPS